MQEEVIEVLKKAGRPLSVKEILDLSSLEKSMSQYYKILRALKQMIKYNEVKFKTVPHTMVKNFSSKKTMKLYYSSN